MMLRHPPLTCKRFARMRVKEAQQEPRLTQLLQEVLQIHHRKKQGVAIQLTVSRWLLPRGSEALKA